VETADSGHPRNGPATRKWLQLHPPVRSSTCGKSINGTPDEDRARCPSDMPVHSRGWSQTSTCVSTINKELEGDNECEADHHHLVMGPISAKSFWVTMVLELQQSPSSSQLIPRAIQITDNSTLKKTARAHNKSQSSHSSVLLLGHGPQMPKPGAAIPSTRYHSNASTMSLLSNASTMSLHSNASTASLHSNASSASPHSNWRSASLHSNG
jgi:hypothetical protein